MTITLQAVNELIQSLESAGELSIKEQKFLKLAKAYQQLAAENAALKKFCKNAAFDADYKAELGMERGGFTDALNNIETPATDRIVAGIKADGVEEFVSNTVHKIFDESEAVSALAYLSLANSHVKQLREGAGK
ncbi:hypothetical protein FKL20_04130 [Klebsiella pneumoniae]|uniref:hypothetical protein n=1 Tax=Klebsiella pneumoniae TaxID=573 RepID=UPI000C79F7B7|nr:hypothetical protein [Klebsiella pneumoniae]MBK2602810.1 hypothetical protein [Klebsiella pneumoniae]PLI68477.1 hypothetical protein B6J50_07295 [Klebsiella pneumoniae]SSG60273.1 Uncharacterised protein [Klebsiella pneumoniae]HBV9606741.1 hypothetical protein [Klebsiella pneumoniae]HBY6251488.1 hypothetical protein [Klebsiella pneumoniae]